MDTITDFNGSTQRRSAGGINRAAAIIGCEVAAMLAVVQVEAGSSGFDRQGRPKMLFEPHVFHAQLKARNPRRLDRAVTLGLAYPGWGQHPYPADSYPRLLQACQIDPEAAFRASSWGLPPILGLNFNAAGYKNAIEMVRAFLRGGEDEHLAAMARFICANHAMREALVDEDWAEFARHYNGPGYKRNAYDRKLAQAYAHAPRVVVDAVAERQAPAPSAPPAPFSAAARNEDGAKGAAKAAALSAGGAHAAAAAATVTTAVAVVERHKGHGTFLAVLLVLAILAAIGFAVHAYLSRRRSIAFTTAAASTAAEPPAAPTSEQAPADPDPRLLR